MKKFKDLVKTNEYWMEEIQNELFRQLTDYMEKTGKSQSQIAKELKVSKSYISQILNGDFNFTLKKLIDLTLYIGKVPNFNFIVPEKYLSNEIERTTKGKTINNTCVYIITSISEKKLIHPEAKRRYTSFPVSQYSVDLGLAKNKLLNIN